MPRDPPGYRYAKEYGLGILAAERAVERGIREHAPSAVLSQHACPCLYPDPAYVLDRFRMLEAARFGVFSEFDDRRIATGPRVTGESLR
jgi:hypothetical protein